MLGAVGEDRRGRIGKRGRKEKREHFLLHSDNKQTLKSLVLKFRDSRFQLIASILKVFLFMQTINQESGRHFLTKFWNYKQGLKDFECHTSCEERCIGMNTHIRDSEMKTDELSSVLASSHEETRVTLAKNRNAVTFQGRWGFRGLVSGEENLHCWLQTPSWDEVRALLNHSTVTKMNSKKQDAKPIHI